MSTFTSDDATRLRERHRSTGHRLVCVNCCEAWPCSTLRALDALERSREEVAHERRVNESLSAFKDEIGPEFMRLRGIEEAARRLRNNAMQSGECEPGRIDVQPMDFAWLCARLNAVSPEKPAAPPTNTENK